MGCGPSKTSGQDEFDSIDGVTQSQAHKPTQNDGKKNKTTSTVQVNTSGVNSVAEADVSNESRGPSLPPPPSKDDDDNKERTNFAASSSTQPTGKSKRLDPADFELVGKTSEFITREMGSINGQQFKLASLTDCTVLLLDHTDQITIDDCQNCIVFVGASSSSIFIRNCENCYFAIAAQQLRLYACKHSTLEIFCMTRPIIESSASLTIMCLRWTFFGQESVFEDAGLVPWDNRWSEIHDFNSSAALATSSNRGKAAGYSIHWKVPSLQSELEDTITTLVQDTKNHHAISRNATDGERSLYRTYRIEEEQATQNNAVALDEKNQEVTTFTAEKNVAEVASNHGDNNAPRSPMQEIWTVHQGYFFVPPTLGVVPRSIGQCSLNSENDTCYIVIILPFPKQEEAARQYVSQVSCKKSDSGEVVGLTRTCMHIMTKETFDTFKASMKNHIPKKKLKSPESEIKTCTKEVKKGKRKKLNMPKWTIMEFRGCNALTLLSTTLESVCPDHALLLTDEAPVSSAQQLFLD